MKQNRTLCVCRLVFRYVDVPPFWLDVVHVVAPNDRRFGEPFCQGLRVPGTAVVRPDFDRIDRLRAEQFPNDRQAIFVPWSLRNICRSGWSNLGARCFQVIQKRRPLPNNMNIPACEHAKQRDRNQQRTHGESWAEFHGAHCHLVGPVKQVFGGRVSDGTNPGRRRVQCRGAVARLAGPVMA